LLQRKQMRGWLAVLALLCAAGDPPSTRAAQAGPGTLVAVAIDASGSLTDADVARSRALATALLESLPEGSEVAVFSFDDQSRLLQSRTSDVARVERALSGVRRTGRFTALHDALYDASRYLGDAPGTRRAIVLLTDGNDENSSLTLEDGLRVAQEARIPVYAVGMGRVQERVLRRIAKLTGGDYLPAARLDGAALAARIQSGPVAASAPDAARAARTPGAARTAAPVVPAGGSAAGTGGSRALVGLWIVLLVAAAAALALLVRHRRAPAAAAAPRSQSTLDRNSTRLKPPHPS
jgi:hypothetical protein